MSAYTIMYNETLKYIKKYYKKENKLILNFQTLRTHHLKQKRNIIIKNSHVKNIS